MREPSDLTPRPDTFFAPSERAAPDLLQQEVELCRESPLTGFLLTGLQGYVAILNEQRQILAASPDLVEAMGPRRAGLIGARLGEAFGCIHAAEGRNGSGTAQACVHCDYLPTVQTALKSDGPKKGECRMSMRRDGRLQAMEFEVTASGLQLGDHRFVAVILRDISAEKHRDALERLFFHDIANILQGLRGWSECLIDGAVQPQEAAQRILHISERLCHEVHSHRSLLQAERGSLPVEPTALQGGLVLQELGALLTRHPATRDRHLDLTPVPDPANFVSDPDLLMRVLYNMGLNAVEAALPKEAVRLSFDWWGNRPRFAVHNPGFIREEVQHHIFKRTFSTKAPKGRGLGTYAMKLFGESFLQGQVGFQSSQIEGTTFWILLPPRLEAPGAARQKGA